MSGSTSSCYIQRILLANHNGVKWQKTGSVCFQSGKASFWRNPRHGFRQYSSVPHSPFEEMTLRKLPATTDYIGPGALRLLNATLDCVVPPLKRPHGGRDLYPGSHLVYFLPRVTQSTLLPDGTDPLHSPGPPFTRRLWAGGTMRFLAPILTNHQLYQINEEIVSVRGRRHGDNQKVLVEIERRIRRRENPSKELCVLETRTLCFMKKVASHTADAEHAVPRTILPQQDPDVSHTIIPTPALLFRFSALTFNAHAIHLDKNYCKEVEGHRNLLVHGPLSILLILQFLRVHLETLNEKSSKAGPEVIEAVEYKNLVPLYAEEEMTICLKRKEDQPEGGSFDVWILGRDGGCAVKGIVKTAVEMDELKGGSSRRIRRLISKHV